MASGTLTVMSTLGSTTPSFEFRALGETVTTGAFPPGPERIVLRRGSPGGGPWPHKEEFELASVIEYRSDDPWPVTLPDGSVVDGELRIVVPPGAEPLPTDLTSVPKIFTWLVPKSGAHLPGALIHDGLYHDADEPKSYRAYVLAGDEVVEDHVTIDRFTADALFREAMGHTGVGVIRRWLIWSALTTATLLSPVDPCKGWTLRHRAYHMAVVALTLAVIVYLGAAATLDLFDRRSPWSDLPDQLPWMPEGPLALEALFGFAGAIVIPVLPGLLWLRYWRAGLITSVALASLLHVTIAVAVVAGVYQLLDLVATRTGGIRAMVALGYLAALVAFAVALVVACR